MIHIKRLKLLYCCVLLSFFVVSACQNEAPMSPEYTAAKASYDANPEDPDAIERLMSEELLGRGKPQEILDLYEKNIARTGDRPMSRIYYATALCQKAGESDKPSEQLKYVRLGMGEFDKLRETYPDDGRVLVWQAVTYSHFPRMLGADILAVEAIDLANRMKNAGTWTFAPGELVQLTMAYLNLAKEFKSRQYFEAAEKQAADDGLEDDPELAAMIDSARKDL